MAIEVPDRAIYFVKRLLLPLVDTDQRSPEKDSFPEEELPLYSSLGLRVLREDAHTGGAWLSSARVVRCWVESRNERNPRP